MAKNTKNVAKQQTDILNALQKVFEATLAKELSGKIYEAEKAGEWRLKIEAAVTKEVEAAIKKTNVQYAYAVTVMVFEKTPFNRGMDNLSRDCDVILFAKFHGDKNGGNACGSIDAVLARL
jgi:CRISPR/Cas system CSM-associated protein Csm2 small subunit